MRGEDLKTLDGKKYSNITEVSKYPKQIFFTCDQQRVSVAITNLSPEVQSHFGYKQSQTANLKMEELSAPTNKETDLQTMGNTQTNADSGSDGFLSAGPWKIKVLWFKSVQSYYFSDFSRTLSPKPPANMIAEVAIECRVTRLLTPAEETDLAKILDGIGPDTRKHVFSLRKTYNSSAILINRSFALSSLPDIKKPLDQRMSFCRYIEQGKGAIEVVEAITEDGEPFWSFSLPYEEKFFAMLIFPFRSQERNPTLMFMPFLKTEEGVAAQIHLDAPGGMKVDYLGTNEVFLFKMK